MCAFRLCGDCTLNGPFYNKRQSQQSATVFALELSDIGSHVGNYCVAPYWLIGILTGAHLNTGVAC